jgi:glycosyltransferase involved in cell wall biosynthesis
MGIDPETFLVGMVLANKADGRIHRKAYAEQMLAFGIFHKEHPDSHLYIHADLLPVVNGFHLEHLREACGIPKEAVTFANRDDLRVGYTDQEMAALYTAMDVLMMATYGEGFGVPVIEAQACGTRVIASNWAATQDLVSEDGFLVEGQPFWHEPQKAFYQIPMLGSLTGALEKAYEADRGYSTASRSFALQFDTQAVWEASWLPFFRELFSR